MVPLPEFVARRADLYAMRGADGDAKREAADRKTVLAIAQLSGEASGVYDRTLSLYLSNTKIDPARALSLAQAEIAVRKDVYGYDALAWALLANGRPADADAAMQTALGVRHPRREAALPRGHDRGGRGRLGPGPDAAVRRAGARRELRSDGCPARSRYPVDTAMRRRLLAGLALATVAAAVVPGIASAHPLGNFTINHHAGIRVEPDRVLLDVVIDQAEIPAFQARLQYDTDGDGQLSDDEIAAGRLAGCASLQPALHLDVAGTAAPLTLTSAGSLVPAGRRRPLDAPARVRVRGPLAAPIAAATAIAFQRHVVPGADRLARDRDQRLVDDPRRDRGHRALDEPVRPPHRRIRRT